GEKVMKGPAASPRRIWVRARFCLINPDFLHVFKASTYSLADGYVGIWCAHFANGAFAPICSSMRRSWLYFASRSLRAVEPILIWPTPVATARSAMVQSSVSPLRAEMTQR